MWKIVHADIDPVFPYFTSKPYIFVLGYLMILEIPTLAILDWFFNWYFQRCDN